MTTFNSEDLLPDNVAWGYNGVNVGGQRMMAEIRFYVGTSGWSYSDWRGLFYPHGLSSGEWLEFYSVRFPTVELNASFYRLPTEKAFQRWHDAVPEGFRFSVKASRYITHIKRLNDIEESLHILLERASLLGAKLGVMLYQLPPTLSRDDGLLDSFLSIAPQSVRHAIEFRNDTWYQGEVYDILCRHNAAFCVHDFQQMKVPVLATADFAYFRFHGTSGRYVGSYGDEELDRWAGEMRRMGQELKAVYAYFNNDIGGSAVNDALRLAERVQRR